MVLRRSPGRTVGVSPAEASVSRLLQYLILCLVPGGAFLVLEWCMKSRDLRWPWSSRDPADLPSTVPPVHPPLERLVSDLHRLEAELARLESSDQPARVRRMMAVSLAYDDTLRSACAALDLPPPEPGRLDGLDRLQVEAELAQAGLRW